MSKDDLQSKLLNVDVMSTHRSIARLARARALSKYKSDQTAEKNSAADSAEAPAAGAMPLPENSPGKPSAWKSLKHYGNAGGRPSNTEPEFNFPDEDRTHQIIILKRCPWCDNRPVIQKIYNGSKFLPRFRVVHQKDSPVNGCGFGQGIESISMKGAINTWNLAVKLAEI